MYVPAADRPDEGDWMRLLRVARVATPVAVPPDGPPLVVPTHFGLDERDPEPVVEFHLHRSNPLWDVVGDASEVHVSILGPYVYVPHDWNARAGTDPTAGVPTSWYAAATLRCRAEPVDDAGLADLLGCLAERFEPGGLPRPVRVGGEPYGPLLPAIRGCRLHVEEVHAKAKFGGNRSADDRRRVAALLRDRRGPGDLEAAEWAARLDRPA